MMTDNEALRILSSPGFKANVDGSLHRDDEYLSYSPEPRYEGFACLDGDFTADELEAIAWWMRRYPQRA